MKGFEDTVQRKNSRAGWSYRTRSRRQAVQRPDFKAAAHSRHSFASCRNFVAKGSCAFAASCSQSAALFSKSTIVASGETNWLGVQLNRPLKGGGEGGRGLESFLISSMIFIRAEHVDVVFTHSQTAASTLPIAFSGLAILTPSSCERSLCCPSARGRTRPRHPICFSQAVSLYGNIAVW